MMKTTTNKMSSIIRYATTHVVDKEFYLENIKGKKGFRNVTRHVDTRRTKKQLDIVTPGQLKVFIVTTDGEFDEKANLDIIYKYAVAALPSHPLGKDLEWGFMAYCPQGTAYVVLPTIPVCETMMMTGETP